VFSFISSFPTIQTFLLTLGSIKSQVPRHTASRRICLPGELATSLFASFQSDTILILLLVFNRGTNFLMERKRLSGVESPRPQAHENNATSNQGNRVHPSGKRVFEVFGTRNSASVKSNHSLSKKASPYTDKFFANVAEAIVRSFPFTEFAKENSCEIKDVVRALKVTVVEPLSKPSIQKSSTPAEYAQREPATLGSAPSIPLPPVDPQNRRWIVSRQPGQTTPPSATSGSTRFSPSKRHPGRSQKGKAAEYVQNNFRFEVSSTATSEPSILLKGGRGVKRRKTMVPVEQQIIKQDAYGNYVPVKSITTASGRFGDDGSKEC
jgi:hypothetical protein